VNEPNEHQSVQDKGQAANSRRREYFVAVSPIVGSVIFDALARMEPAIYGFKWLLIFVFGGLAAVAGVFNLRRLIHGTGWVFPKSDTVIISAMSAQCWLYLIFTHALWK
jgi:hypothetical protein